MSLARDLITKTNISLIFLWEFIFYNIIICHVNADFFYFILQYTIQEDISFHQIPKKMFKPSKEYLDGDYLNQYMIEVVIGKKRIAPCCFLGSIFQVDKKINICGLQVDQLGFVSKDQLQSNKLIKVIEDLSLFSKAYLIILEYQKASKQIKKGYSNQDILPIINYLEKMFESCYEQIAFTFMIYKFSISETGTFGLRVKLQFVQKQKKKSKCQIEIDNDLCTMNESHGQLMKRGLSFGYLIYNARKETFFLSTLKKMLKSDIQKTQDLIQKVTQAKRNGLDKLDLEKLLMNILNHQIEKKEQRIKFLKDECKRKSGYSLHSISQHLK